jgi:hypothetical protein
MKNCGRALLGISLQSAQQCLCDDLSSPSPLVRVENPLGTFLQVRESAPSHGRAEFWRGTTPLTSGWNSGETEQSICCRDLLRPAQLDGLHPAAAKSIFPTLRYTNRSAGKTRAGQEGRTCAALCRALLATCGKENGWQAAREHSQKE